MKHTIISRPKLPAIAFSLCLFLGLFMAAFNTPASTQAAQTYPEVQLPAPGTQVLISKLAITPNATTNSHPGTIYYGAVPANSTSKPVLLFVHGLGGEASDWFTNNDMFTYAYNAGFRAVAVDLYPSGSVWENGQLLSSLIQQICAHYHVATINVVAHSKGGIDTQSAVDFYKAGPYVQNEVTLDTPHHGSQLADLAYSWWSWWLAAILGQRSDATYDLQTSYMAYFRSISDGNSNNRYVDLFTTSGTSHSWPLELFFGGLYLNQYGANDGAVTVASSYNPTGKPIYSFNLNHYDVAVGHNSFNIIRPYIAFNWRGSSVARATSPSVGSNLNANPDVSSSSNLILRGGQITANARRSEQILIEPNVSSVSFQLLTENAALNAVVVGPHGERVPFELQSTSSQITEHIFKGAQELTATISSPDAGNWHVELNAAASASYLLMSNLQSNLKLNLKLGNGNEVAFAPGSNLALNLSGVDNNGLPLHNLQIEGYLLSNGSPANLAAPLMRASGDRVVGKVYRLPTKEGVYNLSLTVTGRTIDNQLFERSLTTSILIGSAQSLAAHSPALEGK